MPQLDYDEAWPDSWKSSYRYDRMELDGVGENRGYINAYDNRRVRTLALIQSVLKPGATLLDIGAAQGNFSIALADAGYDVTWNDLRGELVAYVRLKDPRHRLTMAVGNAFELDFPHLFDCVVVTEIIEHVAHPDQFLAKVATLVKPGGYIVMTTPNGGYFRNKLPRFSDHPDPSVFEGEQFKPDGDGHIFLLHEDEIRRLVALAGLRVDRLELFTNPLTSGHLKLRALLPYLPAAVVNAGEAATRRLPLALRKRLSVHSAALLSKAA